MQRSLLCELHLARLAHTLRQSRFDNRSIVCSLQTATLHKSFSVGETHAWSVIFFLSNFPRLPGCPCPGVYHSRATVSFTVVPLVLVTV